ncbi:tumor necrosis factor receptor superfamily member 14-like isoform 2-T2 [Symphorus nematophorus]
MMIGRKPLTAATMLILVMNFFRGHTLTCHRSEYQTGNECCPMCPAGSRVETDCTEFRPTSCLPCSEGTFMPQPTRIKQCYYCTSCDAGSGLKMKKSCMIKSDTVCEPMEGFHCTLRFPAEEGCRAAQKHRSCPPGQYISQTGTSSRDTECSDCRDGTFSNGTLSSCQPHTQKKETCKGFHTAKFQERGSSESRRRQSTRYRDISRRAGRSSDVNMWTDFLYSVE